MDFPAYSCKEVAVTAAMSECLGAAPAKAYLDRDLLLVYDDEATVCNLRPDIARMVDLPGQGVGITARGGDFDCVLRFFAPKLKVNVDPVTGSVHCMIAPTGRECCSRTRSIPVRPPRAAGSSSARSRAIAWGPRAR